VGTLPVQVGPPHLGAALYLQAPPQHPLLGMWHHLLHMWHDWHYTPGWGFLATIVFGIGTLVVARQTLRQARAIADDTLALNRQQRADTRGDVLRVELARWLTVVSEIEQTCAELLSRTEQTNLQKDENDNPLDAAEIPCCCSSGVRFASV
jgi:hypothetical protein